MFQRNSCHLSNLYILTTEAELVFTVMFQPSLSGQLVFVRVPLFRLFNFVTEMVLEIALRPCENSSTDACPEKNLSELEYTDDVVRLREDSSKQVSVSCLSTR